jgi:DNA repair exonuclease SbcCD ATPase subunit
MKPIRIEATNFRSYTSLDLPIPAGAVAISGQNGSGKSTLLSAIAVGLFAERGELAGCLRHGEDRVETTVEVEHAGRRYRVRRAAGKKAYLDFEEWVDDE